MCTRIFFFLVLVVDTMGDLILRNTFSLFSRSLWEEFDN